MTRHDYLKIAYENVLTLIPYYEKFINNKEHNVIIEKLRELFSTPNEDRLEVLMETMKMLETSLGDELDDGVKNEKVSYDDHVHYLALKSFVACNSWFYYDDDEPIIGDLAYDIINKELILFESIHPKWKDKDSTTQKVGENMDEKRENGVKVTHDVPMLSINDVFTKEDVVEWVNKVLAIHPDATFSVELKIDGLSVTLRYKDGKMVLAETRGNGYVGEIVTPNALVLDDVKETIELKDDLQIRGEIYMTHDNFDRYNDNIIRIAKEKSKEAKLAANPRNLAAGTFRQLDAKITKERGLNIFIFNIQDGPEFMMKNHMDGLNEVDKLGIPTVKRFLCSTTNEVLSAIDAISDMRDSLPFDIDGAVIKIVQTEYRDDFTSAAKYSNGHIAYKYPPQVKETTILDVVEDVGRTGKITVKAILDTVRLGGSKVSAVTLHNQDYIREKGIGIGAKVNVFKSGDVIPKIEKVTKPPKKIFEISCNCPICGEPTFREDGVTDIYCINPSCPAQLIRTVTNFVSLNCMNIMGLGDTYVKDLVDLGYIKDFADIYRLQERKDELINKGILGKDKNTTKILGNIEKSKTMPAEKLLAAFGIRNVGVVTAKNIMECFSSIEDLANAKVEDLVSIKDVGDVTARCIVDFFTKEHNRNMLNALIEHGVNTKMVEKVKKSNTFDGMTIVVTGTLPTMGRKEVSQLIEDHGGKVAGSVSKKTTFVVYGDDAGSKLTKAKDLGIKTITEEELLEMIKE